MLPFHRSLNFLDGAMGPERLFFKAFEDLETKQARDSYRTILFFTLSNACEGRKKERQLFIAWMGEDSQGCGLHSQGTRLVLPSLTGWVTLGKSLTLCALVLASVPML